MNVIDAGSETGSGTVSIGMHTTLLKVKAGTATNVTVNGKTVQIPDTDEYVDIFGDYLSFAHAGSVDWIAFG